MSKAVKMAKVSTKGGFQLLWGMISSTLISSIGTILVARMLSPSDLGIYTVALTAPLLISNFTDWGIRAAITKYSAQYNFEDQEFNVKKILFSGILFETIAGLSLSILSFAFSSVVATNAFQRPNIAPLIQIASLVILADTLMRTTGQLSSA